MYVIFIDGDDKFKCCICGVGVEVMFDVEVFGDDGL